ncbi:hypothetical protein LUZ63_013861 [Rhynchospora breviuscula]|uniref:DUF4408 domain-containing protein n=1 Tax=Rhynchospora breviuscula TaxID=2022672 RepID=A0A9Q0C9B6_9POAL|nr:hypothetical protein LUZ63_013861 [Rhynchospora breviuscula]
MEKKHVSSRQTPLLRAFSRALRLAELSAAFLLVAYATTHLPTLFSFLRRLATNLLHPHFIFLLGNSIVALLLHLSRYLPSSSSSSSPPLYQELLQAHENVVSSSTQQEVVFEDKEAVSVETKKVTRSKSERFEKKRKCDKELKRSDTEVREKRNGDVLEEEEWRPSVEEAEEFRKMIEEFIAKQARFHREESMAIVEA